MEVCELRVQVQNVLIRGSSSAVIQNVGKCNNSYIGVGVSLGVKRLMGGCIIWVVM